MPVLGNKNDDHLQYGVDWRQVLTEGRIQGITTKVTPEPHVMEHLQHESVQSQAAQQTDDWDSQDGTGALH